ncbi:MAG TPA: hypothetical protein VMT02_03915, partial [Burkholderiales bacterium]|nr:hypothetical protein [Burkholderiales bacterium]
MFFGSHIEKKLAELQSRGELPLAVELWNGHRYAPAGRPGVTLRVARHERQVRNLAVREHVLL